MANHTISAKFEAKAGAGLSKRLGLNPAKPGGIVRVPNDIMHLVPQIATMIRELRQVQYATAEERRAIEILSVLQVVRNYEAYPPRPSTDATVISEKDLPPQSEEGDAKKKEEAEKKAEEVERTHAQAEADAKKETETKSKSKK